MHKKSPGWRFHTGLFCVWACVAVRGVTQSAVPASEGWQEGGY